MEECFPLKEENPREKSSFLSKLCFLWMIECSYRANTKKLELCDIYKCPESYGSNENGNYLSKIWNEEIQLAEKRNKRPSLLAAIFRAYYLEYLIFGLSAFMNYILIKGMQPIVLSTLIRFFIAKDYTATDMLTYGGGLCLLVILSLFLQHHIVCGSNLIALRIKLSVSSLIYRKVLRLSQKSLNETATGQVVNLLSNDVARFDTAIQAFHFLWVTPLQLLMIICVIWTQFGSCALGGIIAMVLVVVPFEGLLGHLTGLYRKQAAKKTDYRVKIMSEILSGIQVIKMYAWEKPFENVVHNTRKEELTFIRKTSYIRGIIASMMFLTERLGVCVSVICYSLLGFPVRTDIVFSLSVCFRILQYSLGTMLPAAITIGSELLVSMKRLEKFLMMEEKEKNYNSTPNSADESIILEDVSASWCEKKTTLDNICLSCSAGKLCAIIGPVGSGKSSLLKLLLGEVPKTSGMIRIMGNISFSSQKSWLFSSSVRNNILFDQDFKKSRYKNVLRVCGLTPDLEQLPDNDRTIVGSRGVSLSGGQRARISLARAIYKEADIYLLDDTLSALDTLVGKYVFEECVLEFLKTKTRILVTHQLQYLKKADQIIVLNKGVIETKGTFQELSNSNLDFTKLLPDVEEPVSEDRQKKKLLVSSMEKQDLSDDRTRFIEEKTSSTAQIEGIKKFEGSVFWSYVNLSGNMLHAVSVVVLMLISQLFLNLSDYWITVWSEQENMRYSAGLNLPLEIYGNKTISKNIHSQQIINFFEQALNYSFLNQWTDLIYMNSNKHILMKVSFMRTTYMMIILTAIALMLLRSTSFFYISMKASQNLHDKMFHCLMRAPLKFFNSNPPGNTLNRFSKDIGAADELLPKALINVLGSFLILIGSMVLIIISNWFMVILMFPLWMVLFKMRKWFVTTVKSLRRIEATAKSPVFSYVSSSLDGLTTIRATRSEGKLISQFDRYQDVHTSAAYLALTCSSAFGLWLDMLCILFVCSIVLGFIIMDKYIFISGSFIGLAIFQSMTMVGLFQFCIRSLSESVDYLTSVERVLNYTQLEEEETEKFTETVLPHMWPSDGKIEIKNLYLRYAADEKPILNDLTLNIAPSDKIGIVGRTGAGKSSIIAALLRLAPIEGAILIDGIDTKKIKLKNLRGKFSIIPQEPLLFSASMRYNLDPFYEFTDDRLWKILEEVGMSKSVQSLDLEVTEGGTNFSVGQRQLICLARAILRNNKILILDEATANVDIRTDELIQKTIRRRFSDCTVLTVAHRLNSIMNSDKVLVMEAGHKVEFDHPHMLLQDSNGYLHQLARETGTTTFESLKNTAFESFTLNDRPQHEFNTDQ